MDIECSASDGGHDTAQGGSGMDLDADASDDGHDTVIESISSARPAEMCCKSDIGAWSSRAGTKFDVGTGMQIGWSSGEEKSNPSGGTQGMDLNDDSTSEAEAAGNHLRSSAQARKVKLRTARMPPFGSCSGDRSNMRKQCKPEFEEFEPLNIRLEQVPFAETLATPRHSPVVQSGREPTLRVYGSIRCFPATHVAAKVLTRRNKTELPSCLFFDPEFSMNMYPSERQRIRVVSVRFAEWLMGLPHGWTSSMPLEAATGISTMGVATQQGTRRRKSMSLFSGCGALDLALLPWVEPVLYCEKDIAAKQVLRARTEDGTLPRGTILDDVADVSAAVLNGLREQPEVLTAGFPCQDQAGHQLGLQGRRSGSFFEIIRIIDECPWLEVVFLENVDALRSLEQVWHVVLDAFLARGFFTRWVSLAATSVGCPQQRTRWFFLARRGKSARLPFADSLLLQALDAPGISACRPRVSCPAQCSGIHFNFGRPDPSCWLAPTADYRLFANRLRILGNAVVPQQARLAAQLLSTDW